MLVRCSGRPGHFSGDICNLTAVCCCCCCRRPLAWPPCNRTCGLPLQNLLHPCIEHAHTPQHTSDCHNFGWWMDWLDAVSVSTHLHTCPQHCADASVCDPPCSRTCGPPPRLLPTPLCWVMSHTRAWWRCGTCSTMSQAQQTCGCTMTQTRGCCR
jgi:hypothetical protein